MNWPDTPPSQTSSNKFCFGAKFGNENDLYITHFFILLGMSNSGEWKNSNEENGKRDALLYPNLNPHSLEEQSASAKSIGEREKNDSEKKNKFMDVEDMAMVIKAADFAARRHRFQKRKDPAHTPYINHPIGGDFLKRIPFKIAFYNKIWVLSL